MFAPMNEGIVVFGSQVLLLFGKWAHLWETILQRFHCSTNHTSPHLTKYSSFVWSNLSRLRTKKMLSESNKFLKMYCQHKFTFKFPYITQAFYMNILNLGSKMTKHWLRGGWLIQSNPDLTDPSMILRILLILYNFAHLAHLHNFAYFVFSPKLLGLTFCTCLLLGRARTRLAGQAVGRPHG